MVFQNKFIVCVLVDNQVQKENGDEVTIPFNTSYSLRFRNKNPKRCVVKFDIDGENVSGNGYIIDANSFVDIHRFSEKDVTFKFVDIDSSDAVDFGKNQENNKTGLIEAKFYLEKEQKPVYMPLTLTQTPSWETTPYWYYTPISCNSVSLTSNSIVPTCSNVGCTVEGAASGQTFYTIPFIAEENFTLITLKLKGTTEVVEQRFCTSCGKKRKHSDNFCANCGNKF